MMDENDALLFSKYVEISTKTNRKVNMRIWMKGFSQAFWRSVFICITPLDRFQVCLNEFYSPNFYKYTEEKLPREYQVLVINNVKSFCVIKVDRPCRLKFGDNFFFHEKSNLDVVTFKVFVFDCALRPSLELLGRK